MSIYQQRLNTVIFEMILNKQDSLHYSLKSAIRVHSIRNYRNSKRRVQKSSWKSESKWRVHTRHHRCDYFSIFHPHHQNTQNQLYAVRDKRSINCAKKKTTHTHKKNKNKKTLKQINKNKNKQTNKQVKTKGGLTIKRTRTQLNWTVTYMYHAKHIGIVYISICSGI